MAARTGPKKAALRIFSFSLSLFFFSQYVFVALLIVAFRLQESWHFVLFTFVSPATSSGPGLMK